MAENKYYLDKEGVAYLWQRISEKFADKDALDAKQDKLFEKGAGENSIIQFDTECAATGDYAVATGYNTIASGNGSHTEGFAVKGRGDEVIEASGDGAHAEGSTRQFVGGTYVYASIIAKGVGSHAEGTGTAANGDASHAEGFQSTAEAPYSHVEGLGSATLNDKVYPGWMDGVASHAEGNETTAGGRASHAEGDHTITNNPGEHAEGRYNVSNFTTNEWGNAGNTIHSVGIGTPSPTLAFENSKNAFEIMQNGDVYVLGIGNYNGRNATDTSSKTLQEVVNNGSTVNPTWGSIVGDIDDQADLKAALDDKLAASQIKTINGESIIGDGDIHIEGGVSSWGEIEGDIADQTDLKAALDTKQETLESAVNIKTINGKSILGEGNLEVEAVIPSNYATIEYVDSIKAKTYHSSAYFGTADLRSQPSIGGSELVDAVRADVNDGKMAILKAGDYRYPVVGILNDESAEGTGFRGFVCMGASVDASSLATGNVKPFTERLVILYIAAYDKTYALYSNDADVVTKPEVVDYIQTVLSGYADKSWVEEYVATHPVGVVPIPQETLLDILN